MLVVETEQELQWWKFMFLPCPAYYPSGNVPSREPSVRARKVTTKKLCDKDFAEHSGELSGSICL